MIPDEKKFVDLYRSKQLLQSPDHLFLLHQNCPLAQECWMNAKGRIPNHEKDWNYIYLPFIGDKYSKIKLLAVAGNMNEFGGWYSARKLTIDAKKEIIKGAKRVFRSKQNRYPGTYLWHRLGSYGIMFAGHKGIHEEHLLHDTGFPSSEDVCMGFEYLAFTNHVKCSPKGSRGKPTKQMWKNCGKFILRQEIKILQPDTILIIGKSNNKWSFVGRIFDDIEKERKEGTVIYGCGYIDMQRFSYVVVPHPSWYRISPRIIMRDFQSAIRSIS